MIILFILVLSVNSVNRKNFKTCKEVGFCYRNRLLSKSEYFKTYYEGVPASLSSIPGGVSFEIKTRTETQSFLKAEITLQANNVLHVYIDEISPLYPRYRTGVNDVINPDTTSLLNIHKISKNEVTWDTGSYSYILKLNPFEIQGYYKAKKVLYINQRSLMNFERYRTKKDVYSPIGNYIIDATALPGDMKLWEEKWKDYEDAKPLGPSSIGIDISFMNADYIYGLPEHTAGLSLKNTDSQDPYRLYNLGTFEYEIKERTGLYGSIPFVISKKAGIFWSNPSETWVDVSDTEANKLTHWYSETGVLEFYLFISNYPIELVRTFTMLTGPPLFPPLFGLGYHQSRHSSNTQKDVLEIDRGFLDHDIPLDAIWLGIDHTDDKKSFTWDYQKFPYPLKLLNTLASHGRKLVSIVNPDIKDDDNFYLHKLLKHLNYFIKNPDGEDFKGKSQSGVSSWPDFLRTDVRELWSKKFLLSEYLNTTKDFFISNHMNEPSVFDGPEGVMPKTAVHLAGLEHRNVHNIYGMLMHRSTYEGLLRRNNHRPFVSSRSFYAGSQRYGPVWTGDNTAAWDHLAESIPMCLNIAISGLSFCGSDVGGFYGNPDPELLERWYQVGAYMPFFRQNSNYDAPRREPWGLKKSTLSIIRYSIQQRYQLLPYWYTLFYKYSRDGTPVIRPMFLQYPEDSLASNIEKQYHVGESFIVCLVTKPQINFNWVYLPKARWYDYNTMTEVKSIGWNEYPIEKYWVPVFIKGGSIVPLKSNIKESTFFMRYEPFKFLIVLDENFYAYGDLFLDDETSFEYKTGKYLYSELEFSKKVLTYKVLNSWDPENTIERIVILGLATFPSHIFLESSCIKEEVDYYIDSQMLIINMPDIPAKDSWVLELV
jgi:mannosyl-oligosaccharide alpha-1,3-glucosidase